MKSYAAIGTALAVVVGIGVASAQTLPPTSVDGLVSAARNAAGLDWPGTFLRLCIPPPAASGVAPAAAVAPARPPVKDTWYAEPAKVADNFYFLGTKIHSAWALVGSEGIIILEALYDYAAPDEIAGGMKKLGLDINKVKYVIISHAHADHDGGAKFLQDTIPSAHLVYGGPDWDLVDRSTNHAGGKPKHDTVAADGMKFSTGDASVQIVTTPGHTQGTISFLFEVKDNGRPMRVAYVGGTAIPFNGNADYYDRYTESVRKMAKAAADFGATALMSNHTEFDNAFYKAHTAANRKPGEANPFDVGKAAVGRYFTMVEECTTAARVRAVALVALPLGAASTEKGVRPLFAKAKPEEVGLSSDRLPRIHAAIQRHIDAGDISGAVTLVGRNGRLAYLEAQGLMDLASKKPMSTDTIFHLASMTKPIAGVAVLMLMEEGKLRLNDPVSKFIPELKTLTVAVPMEPGPGPGPAAAAPAAARAAEPRFYTVPAAREITIRDLLTHTSGLVSGGISATEAAKMPRKPTDALADYIPRLAAVPLAFQPGSRWTYSPSAGFDTLGRVVEVVSGQSFDAFLRQRIFEPLGMKDTFFYPPDDRLPRVATIYRRTPEGLEKAPDQRVTPGRYFSGGGGLMSTAEDYLQFGQMLVNGGQLNGKRLLSPTTVELMSSVHVKDTFPGRPPGRSWGLSVQVISDPHAAAMRVSPGSFGWDGAFGTHFWADPKEKIVGLLMVQTSNRDTDRDFENAVMQAIVE